MQAIQLVDDRLEIGAAVTLAKLEEYLSSFEGMAFSAGRRHCFRYLL